MGAALGAARPAATGSKRGGSRMVLVSGTVRKGGGVDDAPVVERTVEVYTCVYIYIYIYVYVYIYIYIHTYAYVYTCTYNTYIYIYI